MRLAGAGHLHVSRIDFRAALVDLRHLQTVKYLSSAKAKRQPVQIGGARDKTCVEKWAARSAGRFATSVGRTVAQAAALANHIGRCKASVDAIGRRCVQ